MWNINAPQGRIPCAIFTKFAEFVPHFRLRLVLKFGWTKPNGVRAGVYDWTPARNKERKKERTPKT